MILEEGLGFALGIFGRILMRDRSIRWQTQS